RAADGSGRRVDRQTGGKVTRRPGVGRDAARSGGGRAIGYADHAGGGRVGADGEGGVDRQTERSALREMRGTGRVRRADGHGYGAAGGRGGRTADRAGGRVDAQPG